MNAFMRGLLSLALLASILCLAVPASAGGGEAVVLNVPPAFRDVTMWAEDGTAYLDVGLLDTNGAWGENGDVVEVRVDILDGDGEHLAVMAFRQFRNVTSPIVVNSFIDLEGRHLDRGSCNVSHPSLDPETNSRYELATSEMTVKFVFDDVEGGAVVQIRVEDRLGEGSLMEMPYSRGSPYHISIGDEGKEVPLIALAAILLAAAGTAYVHHLKTRREDED